jgi:hypothetical protein
MNQTIEQRAVKRCANEIGKAILYARALQGLAKADGYYGIDFIRLAEWAFFDQMFAHAIKVLDTREKSGLSFLLKKLDPSGARYADKLARIKEVQPKLQLVRDKTHFHLDRKGVRDPSAVWKKADISFELLEAAINDAFYIICEMFRALHGTSFELPSYDGSDAKRVAELAYNNKLLEGQWRDPHAPSSIWD